MLLTNLLAQKGAVQKSPGRRAEISIPPEKDGRNDGTKTNGALHMLQPPLRHVTLYTTADASPRDSGILLLDGTIFGGKRTFAVFAEAERNKQHWQ